MQGIRCSYSFDEDYFRVEDAFMLHNSFNNSLVFVNAILTSIYEDTLTFITMPESPYEDGIVKIELKELISKNTTWEIIKLEPDYSKGKFSN